MPKPLRSQTNKTNNNKEEKIKKFPWSKHEQTLKDVVLKNKEEYLDPTPEGYVKLSNELAGPYQIENITADIVRWKFRTKTFKKWLKKQEGTPVNKKRKRESSSSSSSDNSSDSYSDSFSDSESIDQDPVSYRAQQPVFWSLSDSDFT
jgi:hypothetical protein